MIQLAACADCDFLRFPLPPARHAAEKDKSDQLLRAILPDKIADELKYDMHSIGDNFEDVTLLFSDIVSFTKTSKKHSAGEIVEALNDLLSLFDERAKRMGVEKIVESNPDVIMNTLNGDSNIAFFDALLKAGITAEKIPVMSFSISEEEFAKMDLKNLSGNLLSWSYYGSTKTPENDVFVRLRESRLVRC